MKDRKFLFLNLNGGFMSIAQRIQADGYEAFCWYSKESLKGKGNAGEGFIEKVDDYFDIINKFRNNKKQLIIVIDDNSWGDGMDYLRSEGWNVIGSSHFADQAEHEREFGSQLAEKIGLSIPPQWSFTNFKEGQNFLKDMSRKVPDASLVFKGDGYDLAGCLSGDTLIRFNRAGKGFTLSIKDACEKFQGVYEGYGRDWDLKIPTKVRSFNGEKIQLHDVINIVESGIKETYEVSLSDGKKIRATFDHRFLTDCGWVEAGRLTTGHSVLVDNYTGGQYKPGSGKKWDGPNDFERNVGSYHKFARRSVTDGVTYRRLSAHRLVYEAHRNNLSIDGFVEATRKPNELWFMDSSKYVIHHKDGDHFNNEISNLQLLTKLEHLKLHADVNRLRYTPEMSKVVGIKKYGEEMTYDIVCEDPYHNFVANGMVVHNSGKTYMARNVEEMRWFMDWVEKDQQVHEYRVEKFLLQLKIEGVEADFSGWFNGKDFIDYTALTFEQKKIKGLGSAVGCLGNIVSIEPAKQSKLFRDHIYKLVPYLAKRGEINQWAVNTIVSEKDHKPYFLEFCYDDQTEILTNEGWKPFKSLRDSEIVMTLNPETHVGEWQQIEGKTDLSHDGDMIKIGNKTNTIDLVVSPNHDMYLGLTTRRGKAKSSLDWKSIKAEEMLEELGKRNLVAKRGGDWVGDDPEYIEVPEYIEKHWLGKYEKSMDISHPAKKIEAEVFFKFVGLYLAEGNCRSRGQLQISQSNNSSRREEIEEIMRKLPFNIKINSEGDFSFTSIAFHNFLKKTLDLEAKCYNKCIPSRYKDMSPRLLKALLHGIWLGDGSVKDGDIYTTSRVLADDIQEIVMKCGWVANIKTSHKKGSTADFGEKEYVRKSDLHVVKIRKQKVDTWVRKSWATKVHYSGRKYCLTVPNHIIYVRRNGVPVWCCNTPRHGWDSFIGEMTLWQEAGFSPADFYIMLADKTSVPKEVFKKLYSATVRMYSESTGTNGKDVNGKPIKWTNTYEKDFWWYSVKKREDGFCEITDNPVGCATRCAPTIEKASADVYKLLDSKNNLITTPDLFYSPTIGDKAAESEKKVRAWGWF